MWEENQILTERLNADDVTQALCVRADVDLNPELSKEGQYIRDDISEEGYCHLLAIASLDGLVEASQLSRVLGGAGSDVQLMLTRILWEEYGGGKLERKHSSHFAAMLNELGLDSRPEAYLGYGSLGGLSQYQSFLLVVRTKKKIFKICWGTDVHRDFCSRFIQE